MTAFPYKRMIVIGTTGSGKSTLAEMLAKQLGLAFIELDALHWLPGWDHLSDQEFRLRVEQATSLPGWVIAGNYSVARDVSWPRAEVIIWLDYPLMTIFWRLWKRTWRRWWTQELLWGTNRERLWPQFKFWSAEDSLFHWLFKTYWRRKREYPLLFAKPEYAHLKILHMHSPEETQAWLAQLESVQPLANALSS
jgi:adenylate kinase family enzyme